MLFVNGFEFLPQFNWDTVCNRVISSENIIIAYTCKSTQIKFID